MDEQDKVEFLIGLMESPSSDYGKKDITNQRYEQKVFSAVCELEHLVNDGGFAGYFGNGAELAGFAPEALRAIGAQKCATIVQDAVSLAPSAMPADLDARWEIMRSLPEPAASRLDKLTSDFFTYPDNLTELLFAFVVSHPVVFGLETEDNPNAA